MTPQATSKDKIRTRNLSAVLELVHREGTVSRAQLGARLGLSKTTIAELVDELESLHLIERIGNLQSGTAGRPTQLVSPAAEKHVLVVNPEIDGLNVALVDFAQNLHCTEFLSTNSAYSLDSAISLVKDYWRNLSADDRADVVGICLALPGAIDSTSNRLIAAPSLGWFDLDASARFAVAFGLPVWATNNARAATVSEHRYGVARGANNAACLFSGAGGIGGGMILNGRVHEGAHGLAGELGKIALLVDGSGRIKTFGDLLNRGELVESVGLKTADDGQLEAALAATESARALRTMDEQVRYLIAAIQTLRDLHDPDLIVFGGYLGILVKLRLEEILKILNENALLPRGRDFLVPRVTELKPMVMIGAAEAAWAALIANPYLFETSSNQSEKGRK